MYRSIVIALISAGSLTACVPSHLAKYQKSPTNELETMGRADALAATPQPKVRSKRSANIQPIVALSDQTFRFRVKEEQVWEAAINALIKNYNINIVDKKSGIVTTEWDTFYLDGAVYRNKVSLRLERVGWNSVDVTILNNVETLKDTAGALGSVWLPGEDVAGEASRVIYNLALLLDLSPPTFPAGMSVAKGLKSGNSVR